jgi:hypothetical protein
MVNRRKIVFYDDSFSTSLDFYLSIHGTQSSQVQVTRYVPSNDPSEREVTWLLQEALLCEHHVHKHAFFHFLGSCAPNQPIPAKWITEELEKK